jgi:hypothetical protein
MIQDSITDEIRTADSEGMLERLIEHTMTEDGDDGWSVRYYRTEDGEPVEKVSDAVFVIVKTQRILTRFL